MSEVRLVVAILVPAIFTLILKDFFDLFMTNRYEGKVKQYTIWMLYFLLDTAISMNFKFVGVISMLYSFIILIIFCAVLYREDIKYITLTVLFIICIGAASELIVALGIRAFLNSSQLQQFSLFGSTCSKLIILIIVRIVKLFRVSGIKRLDYMNWLANVSMTADNAIEGALKCVSRRYIHIKIIYRKENLFIKISNSFDGKVKKDRHGHLISMKSDLTRYGLGLALIEK